MASAYDGPAGVEALCSRPVAQSSALHALAVTPESLACEACPGGSHGFVAHTRRKSKVMRLHGGYRPARASAHDSPAGLEALYSLPTDQTSAVHVLVAVTDLICEGR